MGAKQKPADKAPSSQRHEDRGPGLRQQMKPRSLGLPGQVGTGEGPSWGSLRPSSLRLLFSGYGHPGAVGREQVAPPHLTCSWDSSADGQAV